MKHHEKCENTLTIHENNKHKGKNHNNTGKTIKTKKENQQNAETQYKYMKQQYKIQEKH